MEMVIWNGILCVGFLISFAGPHMPDRRAMLLNNVVACTFFGAYFYGVGELSAMMAIFIAGTSSLIQSSFSPDRMDDSLPLRLFIACIMAGLAIKVTYHDQTDLLPLIAVLIVRFAESLKTQQLMRIANLLPALVWVYFNGEVGLYLAAFGDFVVVLSLLLAIYREEQFQKIRIRKLLQSSHAQHKLARPGKHFPRCFNILL